MYSATKVSFKRWEVTVKLVKMPNIGHVGEFDPSSESLNTYLDRINEYFVANSIGVPAKNTDASRQAADRQKVAALNSIIGKAAYSVLNDLTKPDKPSTKTFAELCALLHNHYQPKTKEVAEIFKFHRCMQLENETVNTYTARLRGMADKCNFGRFLNRALRDQFVSGIRNRDTQRKLLEEDRDFQECVTIAAADETARRESETLQAASSSQVHFVSQSKKNPTYKKPVLHTRSSRSYKCYSCGQTDHKREKCKFRDAECHKCKRKGHISKVCQSEKLQLLQEEDEDEGDSEGTIYAVSDSVRKFTGDAVYVPLRVEGKLCKWQLDTGSKYTVVPKWFLDQYFPHVQVDTSRSSVSLIPYKGDPFHPYGEALVKVEYEGHIHTLPIIVVEDGPCALFGREWLRKIQLNWKKIFKSTCNLNSLEDVPSVPVPNSVQELLDKHSTLFNPELGCYKGSPLELPVTSQPGFYKPRVVPYALRDRVKIALDKMEADGVIVKVDSSPVAAPLVPVGKSDGSGDIRLCGDFSVTYNRCAEVVTHPIPKVEDVHAAMRGCSVFSVLDMSSAYHQLSVSEQSQVYLTANTQYGLYRFSRLPFGVHSAPALFQRTMESVLAGIPHVISYLDDILIGGVDETEHRANLAKVFTRLEDAGFRLKKKKCHFSKTSVTYLGHRIDAEGLHPTAEKLKAIQDAPAPKDVSQLKSFLGLIMFH